MHRVADSREAFRKPKCLIGSNPVRAWPSDAGFDFPLGDETANVSDVVFRRSLPRCASEAISRLVVEDFCHGAPPDPQAGVCGPDLLGHSRAKRLARMVHPGS